jgi:hypothetical protein
MAASCDNGSGGPIPPPTVQDITIPYGGKTITVKGLMSDDTTTRAKMTEAVGIILGDSGSMSVGFQNYVRSEELIITVENVPAYAAGWEFRVINKNEFAMRYDFVSTNIATDIMIMLAVAVDTMNDTYHIVP